ncbi:aspartic peptidase domain-containing protein [Cyathus striatus]|nr:aspartic peptidase domain-containing protein [Cyathus striatus]
MRAQLRILLALTFYYSFSNALRLPLQLGNGGTRFSSLEQRVDSSNQISSLSNFRYVTNITLNGESLMVILDTGSSGLWVNPLGGMSGGDFKSNGKSETLTIKDDTKVTGDVGFAPLEFVGHSVKQQGFLNVISDEIVSSINEGEILGVLGLGFTTDDLTASGISTVLENIFQDDPALLPFFVFDLARLDLNFGDRGYGGVDASTYSSGGYLTLGEYEDHYKNIASAPYIPLFPAPDGTGGQRWAIPFDGVILNGTDFTENSNVTGAPKGKLIHVMDTGTPDVSLPSALFAQIYSSFPGAVKFSLSSGVTEFVFPCNATTPVVFVYGGQSFTVHPIDLVSANLLTDASGEQFLVCQPAFTIDDESGSRGSGFDNLIGASFLRSVYNFGDATATGEASIQMVSKINLNYDEALKEHTAWYSQLQKDMKAAKVSDFYENVVAGTTKSTSGNYKPVSTSSSIKPTATPNKTGSTLAADDANVLSSTDSDSSLLSKYGPAIIGLLAANLFIGLVLVVLGIANYIKGRGRSSTPTRSVNPAYAPVPLKDEPSITSYQKPYNDI